MKITPALAAVVLVSVLAIVPSRSEDPVKICLRPKPKPAKKAAGPAKQIYELSHDEQSSACLGASGVAAYVVSAFGTNRGLLIKNVDRGFAANVGLQPGDVLLQINSRVIQTGRDADRVLESTQAGAGHVLYVHQGDAGLQLLNQTVNMPHFANSAPPMMSSGSSSGSHAGGEQKNDAAAIPLCESYLAEVVNHDRQKNGSPPIQVNSALSKLAREKAEDMAKRNYFSHEDPDGVGPQDRARRAGIAGGVFENIAWQSGYQPIREKCEQCENQMMGEPPNQQNHRSNILDPNHASMGMGVAIGKGGKVFLAQEFSHVSP